MKADEVIKLGAVGSASVLAVACMALGPVGWGAAVIYAAGALAITYL